MFYVITSTSLYHSLDIVDKFHAQRSDIRQVGLSYFYDLLFTILRLFGLITVTHTFYDLPLDQQILYQMDFLNELTEIQVFTPPIEVLRKKRQSLNEMVKFVLNIIASVWKVVLQ